LRADRVSVGPSSRLEQREETLHLAINRACDRR
jgi:hypothetical protein